MVVLVPKHVFTLKETVSMLKQRKFCFHSAHTHTHTHTHTHITALHVHEDSVSNTNRLPLLTVKGKNSCKVHKYRQHLEQHFALQLLPLYGSGVGSEGSRLEA